MFSRAYAVAPLCNQSRAALLAGIARYRLGVYDNKGNDSRLPRDVVHLPQAFMAGGYRAVGAGKIYHSGNNRGRWDEYWPSLTDESQTAAPESLGPLKKPRWREAQVASAERRCLRDIRRQGGSVGVGQAVRGP